MIEYIAFVEDKAKNREELAKDVKGVKCTYVGPVSIESLISDGLPIREILKPLTLDQWCSSAEFYANGRVNIYVRENQNPVAVGFLRVTP